jgi:hypothetical protein
MRAVATVSPTTFLGLHSSSLFAFPILAERRKLALEQLRGSIRPSPQSTLLDFLNG